MPADRNGEPAGVGVVDTVADPSYAGKKNRPKGTRFRQQKLPAWQPILTASTVIPAFLVVGIIFVPVGGILIAISSNVVELSHEYTNCMDTSTNQSCALVVPPAAVARVPCTCQIELNAEQMFEGDVYFYYGLTNFYQNHRRYVRSRNDEQLLGYLDKTTDCSPFEMAPKGGKDSEKPYAPCGAIANSMFNDTFKLEFKQSSGVYTPVPLTYEGIAWSVDKDRKFKNPPGNLSEAFKNTAKPIAWSKNIWELDLNDPSNNGFMNADFQVWMRTAALPNFRKLWRKLVRVGDTFKDGLPAGTYRLTVGYNYPVTAFNGGKLFVMSTTSFMGGKNNFLGVAYVTVGSLCLILALAFLIIHIRFGKSLTEVNAVRGGNT